MALNSTHLNSKVHTRNSDIKEVMNYGIQGYHKKFLENENKG